jgi:cytochrome c-type biogenesis protein CcmH/NrfG
MHLHTALWFAAGLSLGLAAGWMPWGRLLRYRAQPAVQAVTWPVCGALIVLLPALSLSAWRARSDPGHASQAGASTGRQASHGAGVAGGAPIGGSVPAAADRGKAHGTASLDAMLGKLERRVRGGSIDPNDCELLAQTYAYLGRADDASDARLRHVVAAAAMLADTDSQIPQILGQP